MVHKLQIEVKEREDTRLDININNTTTYDINYFKDYGYFITVTFNGYIRSPEGQRHQPESNIKFKMSRRDSLFGIIPIMNDGFTDITVRISLDDADIYSDFFEGEIEREYFDKFMDIFEDIDVEKNLKLFRQTLISKTDNKITETLPAELVNQIVKLL